MLDLLTSSSSQLSPEQLPRGAIQGLYMHVPFCFHKCHYCDFYSITRQTPDRMRRFVDLMLREARSWTASDATPSTVFIGGGTPTLLGLEDMQRLLWGVKQHIDLSAVDEWTVEANPATVTQEYCDMLKANGVTRLSFGAQSFNAAELKMLERHHDPDDVYKSVQLARAAGFTRLNLDLIFAIPGQDLRSWQSSLAAGLSLATTHLSCYGLTYEPSTPLAVRRRLGHFKTAVEELELAMLVETRRWLTSIGMPPYEISNFAAPGEACRHNLNYWKGGNYLGLGPSAASHVEGVRWKNRPHLGEWETAVESGGLPAIEIETLTPQQRAGEVAMLMLRLDDGLDLDLCSERSGFNTASAFAPVIARLRDLGMIEEIQNFVRLSERGISVADAVAAEFLL